MVWICRYRDVGCCRSTIEACGDAVPRIGRTTATDIVLTIGQHTIMSGVSGQAIEQHKSQEQDTT